MHSDGKDEDLPVQNFSTPSFSELSELRWCPSLVHVVEQGIAEEEKRRRRCREEARVHLDSIWGLEGKEEQVRGACGGKAHAVLCFTCEARMTAMEEGFSSSVR